MHRPIECTLKGEEKAGADRSDICAFFAEAIAETGREDIASIRLVASSDTEAQATLLDASGEVVAELGYAIMDRKLGSDSWQMLASALAREVRR